MFVRWSLAAIVLGIAVAAASAQTAGNAPSSRTSPAAKAPASKAPTRTVATGWRPPGNSGATGAAKQPAGTAAPGGPVHLAQGPQAPRASIARVTKGDGTLPNDHGQVWREYDISPYTMRVTSTNTPQQSIIKWILRETGYEAWHADSVAMLSANKRTLRCYHTPQVQAVVSEIVDRFVSSEAETQAFGLRIVTIGNPNWRAKALRLMKPVPVQSQGIQGWLLAKEDAALLLAGLQKRTDFREHSSPHLLVNNGQSIVVSTIRPRMYVRGVRLREGAWPGYDPDTAQIDEGYSLEFSPLLSLDGQTVDAVIKLRLSQVEKMVPVMLEVPTNVAPNQRTRIEVPQAIASNLHERFRWPTDHILLLSMGVVASPGADTGNLLTNAIPLPKGPARADALLFVECKGKLAVNPATAGTARNGSNFPRRY